LQDVYLEKRKKSLSGDVRDVRGFCKQEEKQIQKGKTRKTNLKGEKKKNKFKRGKQEKQI